MTILGLLFLTAGWIVCCGLFGGIKGVPFGLASGLLMWLAGLGLRMLWVGA